MFDTRSIYQSLSESPDALPRSRHNEIQYTTNRGIQYCVFTLVFWQLAPVGELFWIWINPEMTAIDAYLLMAVGT